MAFIIVDTPAGFHRVTIGIGKDGLEQRVPVVDPGIEDAHGHRGIGIDPQTGTQIVHPFRLIPVLQFEEEPGGLLGASEFGDIGAGFDQVGELLPGRPAEQYRSFRKTKRSRLHVHVQGGSGLPKTLLDIVIRSLQPDFAPDRHCPLWQQVEFVTPEGFQHREPHILNALD